MKGLSTPVWDGKAETCPRYLDRIEALAEFYNCGNALDSVKMLSDCPMKSEFDAILSTTTDSVELAKIKLYKENKRLCSIITLGQKMDHGLFVMKKTKSDDFPQGLAYRILEILKQKNKPKDVTAKIELKKELEKVKFSYADDYYKDVIAVTDRFDVAMSETELIEILAKQVTSSTYVSMIVNHLKASTADDLETLCRDISEIQQLSKTTGGSSGGNRNCEQKEKEVQLTSTDFKGICGFCNKRAGHKRKFCPERKKKSGRI